VRSLDRLLALVAGLALAAVGGLVAAEAVLLEAGRPPWLIPRHRWDHNLRTLAWDDNSIRTASIILLAAGAVLLLAQLIPRRPLRFPLKGRPGLTVWLSRRGLQRRLERAVTQDLDVESSRARVGRRRTRVDVRTVQRADRQALAHRLDDRGRRSLERLALLRAPRLRYRYHTTKVRVR
jgi:hypothetical protein